MLFLLQSAAEKRRAVHSRTFDSIMYSIMVQVSVWPTWKDLTPLFQTYIKYLTHKDKHEKSKSSKSKDLKPPVQQGASTGLLHNRNSPSGLTRQFFCCGQRDKDRVEDRKARPPLLSIHAEPSCLTHIHTFTTRSRLYAEEKTDYMTVTVLMDLFEVKAVQQLKVMFKAKIWINIEHSFPKRWRDCSSSDF